MSFGTILGGLEKLGVPKSDLARELAVQADAIRGLQPGGGSNDPNAPLSPEQLSSILDAASTQASQVVPTDARVSDKSPRLELGARTSGGADPLLGATQNAGEAVRETGRLFSPEFEQRNAETLGSVRQPLEAPVLGDRGAIEGGVVGDTVRAVNDAFSGLAGQAPPSAEGLDPSELSTGQQITEQLGNFSSIATGSGAPPGPEREAAADVAAGGEVDLSGTNEVIRQLGNISGIVTGRGLHGETAVNRGREIGIKQQQQDLAQRQFEFDQIEAGFGKIKEIRDLAQKYSPEHRYSFMTLAANAADEEYGPEFGDMLRIDRENPGIFIAQDVREMIASDPALEAAVMASVVQGVNPAGAIGEYFKDETNVQRFMLHNDAPQFGPINRQARAIESWYEKNEPERLKDLSADGISAADLEELNNDAPEQVRLTPDQMAVIHRNADKFDFVDSDSIHEEKQKADVEFLLKRRLEAMEKAMSSPDMQLMEDAKGNLKVIDTNDPDARRKFNELSALGYIPRDTPKSRSEMDEFEVLTFQSKTDKDDVEQVIIGNEGWKDEASELLTTHTLVNQPSHEKPKEDKVVLTPMLDFKTGNEGLVTESKLRENPGRYFPVAKRKSRVTGDKGEGGAIGSSQHTLGKVMMAFNRINRGPARAPGVLGLAGKHAGNVAGLFPGADGGAIATILAGQAPIIGEDNLPVLDDNGQPMMRDITPEELGSIRTTVQSLLQDSLEAYIQGPNSRVSDRDATRALDMLGVNAWATAESAKQSLTNLLELVVRSDNMAALDTGEAPAMGVGLVPRGMTRSESLAQMAQSVDRLVHLGMPEEQAAALIFGLNKNMSAAIEPGLGAGGAPR